jgi:Gpi18-like mannosyltransferase
VLLIALLLLRWWLGTLPGYPPDLQTYKRWALTGALQGVHTIYDEARTTYDYPPLYAYLLTPVGQLYHLIAPEAAEAFADSRTFSLLVKIPPLAFDILLALVIGTLAGKFGLWGRRRTWAGWLPALLYLFHPAVLFNSGYWGQPDVVHIFLVLLGLTLILLRKTELGWISVALACLMKPLAVPFLPLLAVATLVRSGWLRLLTGGLTALATGLAVLLPFILTGRGELVVQRLFFDVTLMPYTSVNSHNIWWLLGPWRDASAPSIGPLTPTMIGLALFGIVYLLALWKAWQIERGRSGSRWPVNRGSVPLHRQHHWYLAAAAVAFSFFVFSTHMHENHLFGVIPFLILPAAIDRRWTWLCALVGFSILINMVVHDLFLHERLLSQIGGASGYIDANLSGYYGETTHLSRLELALATGNSILALLLFAAFAVLGWKHGRTDGVDPAQQ